MARDKNPLHRLELMVGAAGLEKLAHTRVILFGTGGVGGWAAEALVRSGIGHLTMVDDDVVCITNVNRQLQATPQNVGKSKVLELQERLVTLNPQCEIVTSQTRFTEETATSFCLSEYDYVIDCIDSISCKLVLIVQAGASDTTLVSSMGAACKMDPSRIRVASIWESSGCGLARKMRNQLRGLGYEGDFQVVYSQEIQVQALHKINGRRVNGSAVHITATFGMFLAGQVIQAVLEDMN